MMHAPDSICKYRPVAGLEGETHMLGSPRLRKDWRPLYGEFWIHACRLEAFQNYTYWVHTVIKVVI